MTSLGLYIHIPFCIKKCLYCDFYSIPSKDEALRARYITALKNHIKEYSVQAKDYGVNSIYFGGGTPSLLTPNELRSIMKEIKSSYNLSRNCEISMEVNPGTVDENKLMQYRKIGINRLSIGMQSFVPSELTALGRIHTVSDSIECFNAARQAGFKNINIDLMYGLPKQNAESAVETFTNAMQLCPEHISYYCLKIEEGTPFYSMQKSLHLPDDDTESEIYLTLCALLNKYGYDHYEISNFAKRGKKCRHNIKYWSCDSYLGFGAAAHSYFGGKRFSYKRDINAYCSSFCDNQSTEIIDEYIDIPMHTQIAEYVMLRLRLKDGINTKLFKKRFMTDFEPLYIDKMAQFLQSGHIIRTKHGFALTEGSMYVSNYILSRIVDFDLQIDI